MPAFILEQTAGRGPDSVIDAVGMEAHGNPVAKIGQELAARLPGALGEKAAGQFGVDRLKALLDSIRTVRRGGTLSVSGVYGGAIDPLPMLDMFDKGIQLRMGQCHVRRWIAEIMPYLEDDADPLGTADMASHYLPLDQAPQGYEKFQNKSRRLHQGHPPARPHRAGDTSRRSGQWFCRVAQGRRIALNGPLLPSVLPRMSSGRSGAWGPRHGPDAARRRDPVPVRRVVNLQGIEVLEHLAGGRHGVAAPCAS